MTNPFDPSILQPGDALIYSGFGMFDLAIEFRTACWAAHIEVVVDTTPRQMRSVASRNGIGINLYPLRIEGLRYVLQPRQTPDMLTSMAWFDQKAKGQPYNWLDLVNFIVPWDSNIGRGQICSEFACNWYRAAAIEPFATDWDAGKVSPRDFVESPAFTRVWG